MCFSATGSFIAAGINAAAGAAVLPKVEGGPEQILASFPLLFAAQQAIEGGCGSRFRDRVRIGEP